MTSADRVGLSVLLDRHPEVGGDGRYHPGPTLQVLDVSTVIVKQSKTFKKRFLALTARRQEVAMLAARGLPNRAIGEKLNLTEGTVKSHLNKIYKTLDLHSKIELVVAVGKMPRVKARLR